MLASLSMLGLLSSWICDHALFNPKSNGVKEVMARVGGGEKLHINQFQSFRETLISTMNRMYHPLQFSQATNENLNCKIEQLISNSDAYFCDLHLLNELLFRFHGERIYLITGNGDVAIPGLSLIDRFPYGNEMLRIEEIAEMMGTVAVFQSEEQLLYKQNASSRGFNPSSDGLRFPLCCSLDRLFSK